MTNVTEFRQYLGRNVSVTYRDRSGDLHTRTTHVHDVAAIPVRGVCLICDNEDIWMDTITRITSTE